MKFLATRTHKAFLVFALTFGFGGSANADTFVGPNNLCMATERSRRTEGTHVIVQTCNGSSNQQWRFLDGGDSNYEAFIQHIDSGLCLNVKGGGRADGTPLILWECTSNAGNNYFQFGPGVAGRQGSLRVMGRCVSVYGEIRPGARLGIFGCDGKADQGWDQWG